MELVAIELDNNQATFLNLCQKNYATIGFMYSSGVFDIRSGNAILSFSPQGVLKSIKRELFSYRSVDNKPSF